MNYYSDFTAIVEDRNDPDKLGKLKLNIPDLADAPIWVEPSSFPHTGKNGIWMLPEKGDAVRVRCEQGDPSFPVWDFGFFLEKNLPKIMQENYDKAMILTYEGAELLLTKQGKFQVRNQTENLQSLLLDILSFLTEFKIPTQMGPQSVLPPDILKVEQFKTRLKNLIDE